MPKHKLVELFKQQPNRAKEFSVTLEGLHCDFSKCHLDGAQFNDLIALAKQVDLRARIDDLFDGKELNFTEHRPALHTALRAQSDIKPEVLAVQQRMRAISDKIRAKEWLGYSDKPITDVVNIGIGGSDLGPVVATRALMYLQGDIKVHFLSNIDGHRTEQLLNQLNPETTLFLIASKSFTTQETLTNADSCKQWLLKSAKDANATSKHFLALTAKPERAEAYGIEAKNILPLWNWVGGRYSMWSAIGLPIAISIGMDNFIEFLKGAAAMDAHFKQTEFDKNLPVILALLGHYYINECGADTHAIMPYDETLAQLPAYIQQLDMESNGKSVKQNGDKVTGQTAPIIWGAVGSNSQHSCLQLLHQGTELVPIDFIIAKKPHHALQHHHDILVANCFAQAQALMCGKTEQQAYDELMDAGVDQTEAEWLAKHKVIAGNKPSTVIMLDEITPFALGMLIALYEHKVFVQGVLWGINSFDQWGVELGKQLSPAILAAIQSGMVKGDCDASTLALVDRFKESK
tara:strand:+ start:215798 stop:217351 length:1554 start_codon:yes stop_codon:yes gene_type:complete